MEYRATAAVPSLDPAPAVSRLRARLRAWAAADGATVDWATLHVTGPVEVVATDGQVRYEWTATARTGVPAGA